VKIALRNCMGWVNKNYPLNSRVAGLKEAKEEEKKMN
jgi:hypothetical protein